MPKSQRIAASVQGPRLILILVVLVLVLFGMVMVYSSSMVKAINAGDDPTYYVFRQAFYVAVGIAVCLAVWKLPVLAALRRFDINLILWGCCVGFIVATALVGSGDEEWGAKRWISLGSVSLQPSEFIKIGMVIFSAYLFNQYREGGLTLKELLIVFAVAVVIPVGFMYKLQSDLGTTLVIAVGVLAVLWLGGANKWVLLIIVVVGLVVGYLAITGTSYRAARMSIFLNPWNDGMNGQGDGWQSIHSYWAFAEGGLTGVGLGNSYEKYSYLPMAETDFIYAIIGEELGMVGALAVMVLFVAILVVGLRIAYSADNAFSTMLCVGLTVMLVFQAFLNMGCAVGCLPTTGKPLPFISAGGSSVIASLMMVGLMLAVSEEAGQPSQYERRRDDLRVVHAVDGGGSSREFSARRTGAGTPVRSSQRSSRSDFSRRRR